MNQSNLDPQQSGTAQKPGDTAQANPQQGMQSSPQSSQNTDPTAQSSTEPAVSPAQNQSSAPGAATDSASGAVNPQAGPNVATDPAAADPTTTTAETPPVITPQQPAQQSSAPQQAGGSKKLPLLLGVLVIILLVAAAGWWYVNQQSTTEPVVVEQEAVPTETPMMEATPMPEFDEAVAPPATGATETGQATESADADTEAEVRTITIEAGSYYYEPAEIRVQQGETVRLELTSSDMVHNLIIDELDISIPMTNAGETNSVEFTADQPGTYTYFCGVDGHREAGQIGQLIIE
ncbi:MAG: cupredoxin domain-containing protein [Patescibacteria group bacterium]